MEAAAGRVALHFIGRGAGINAEAARAGQAIDSSTSAVDAPEFSTAVCAVRDFNDRAGSTGEAATTFGLGDLTSSLVGGASLTQTKEVAAAAFASAFIKISAEPGVEAACPGIWNGRPDAAAGGGGGYDDGKVDCVVGSDRYSQNYAVNGFWKPSETGIIPAISAGYGWTSVEKGSSDFDTANWMVGLTWKDVVNSGHTFNLGFGVPQYVTSDSSKETPGLTWEASLKMKVANNITVVPAIFYIPEQTQGAANDSAFGGVVQTVFKF